MMRSKYWCHMDKKQKPVRIHVGLTKQGDKSETNNFSSPPLFIKKRKILLWSCICYK